MPEDLTSAALRRRGWIVLAAIIIAAAAAYGIATWRGQSFTSEALVVVSNVSNAGPGNADQAVRLALTYAEVVKADAALGRVATKAAPSGAPTISATARPNTSILTLSCRAATRAEAVACARAVADGMTGASPASPGIAASSLTTLAVPAAARPVAQRFEAVATLEVPAGVSPPSSNSDQASKLALTYTGVIPNDTAVRTRLARALSESTDTIKANLSATSDANTALIHLDFKDKSARKAFMGVRTLAQGLTASVPISDRITPGSLEVVELPSKPEEASGKTVALVAGVIFGALLGLVLLTSWERADPRVDSVRDLEADVDCPVTQATPPALIALLGTLGSDPSARRPPMSVAVMPLEPGDSAVARHVSEALTMLASAAGQHESGFVPPRVELVEAPGDHGGEVLALRSNVVVLVTRNGARSRRVLETTRMIHRFNAEVAWCLLTDEVTAEHARLHAGDIVDAQREDGSGRDLSEPAPR